MQGQPRRIISNHWCVDNGCSEHFPGDISLFYNFSFYLRIVGMLSLKEMMKVRSAQKVQSKFNTLICMISFKFDDGTVKQKQQK